MSLGTVPIRIGFLFNHDQTHQIAHSLPVAMALFRRNRIGEVLLATGQPRIAREIERLLAISGQALPLIELGLSSFRARALQWILAPVLPIRKLAIYRENIDFFRSLDILVVTEKTSTLLKTRYGLDQLRMIHTRHGAGDRAIGFDAASARFDLVLVAGPLLRDRLVAEAGVPPERVSIVGYPKFDMAPPVVATSLFRDPDRPIVLYNPHVAPHLSSWYRHGRAVLDFFLHSDRYNLIFAPHVMLFERRVTVTMSPPRVHFSGTIPRRIRAAANIHIDLGSSAATDMSYTNAADIYLGDASSQIYEFIRTPRACIFLNSHRYAWEGNVNFAHWTAGRVIDSPDQLGVALEEAIAVPTAFRLVQQRLFEEHIELTDEPSSERAAAVIERLARLSG